MADISRTVDQSHLSARIKAILRDCIRQLEAECATLKHMTQLAHRAANDASNVLQCRIRFFKALDDRIRELSRLREGFVECRRVFRGQPTNLLTGEIRKGKRRYLMLLITYLLADVFRRQPDTATKVDYFRARNRFLIKSTSIIMRSTSLSKRSRIASRRSAPRCVLPQTTEFGGSISGTHVKRRVIYCKQK